ncbi:Flagellar basal-body rod protein FlgF [compost metagenome]
MSERPGTDFSAGSLQATGRDLDIAAKGEAWIAVQAPDGGEAYVRTGSLEVDALGQLRTGDGLPVIGNGGPIAVPPQQKIEIGEDGTISIRGLGENPTVMAEVDRIKLVTPDPKQLEKGTDGLVRFKPQPGQQAPLADADAKLQSGFLESSNVNAVEEMTSILALSRQFELHVKMMRTAEDDSAAMARVLQFA